MSSSARSVGRIHDLKEDEGIIEGSAIIVINDSNSQSSDILMERSPRSASLVRQLSRPKSLHDLSHSSKSAGSPHPSPSPITPNRRSGSPNSPTFRIRTVSRDGRVRTSVSLSRSSGKRLSGVIAKVAPVENVQVHPAIQRFRDAGLDVLTSGVGSLILAIDEGRITCVEIMEAYLAQIELHNDRLKALVYIRNTEDLLKEARLCDEERKGDGWSRLEKPLHGIPVVVKDNIATDEELGMPTTAGSYALKGMPVPGDSFVVKQLRGAGAIIMAKANMSELASYKSAGAGEGWSPVGGQTINVYAAHASPGSSSSGNGVALAAGFCPVSIGTETDGSITYPCMQSSLYGLKPTTGLLSRTGIVPFAPYFDTAGPMAKDPMSLAIAMDVVAAQDLRDERTLGVKRLGKGISYMESCKTASFQGLRIGVPRKNWQDIDPWAPPGPPQPLSPEISHALEKALQRMSEHGAEITDPAEIPSALDGSLWECVRGERSLVVSADCNYYLGEYLKSLGGEKGEGVRSVKDIIEFNKTHSSLEMPPDHPGQEILERCLTAASIHSPEYAKAITKMQLIAGTNGLDSVLDNYGLDAIIAVRKGSHSIANMVGAPIAAVPLGFLEDGEPFGVSFMARRGGEEVLFRIMAAWEVAFGPRVVPVL